MLEKFLNIFRIPDLRKRVLFTLGILAVYRLGAFIPTPGINTRLLEQLFNMQSSSALGLMDLFGGGPRRGWRDRQDGRGCDGWPQSPQRSLRGAMSWTLAWMPCAPTGAAPHLRPARQSRSESRVRSEFIRSAIAGLKPEPANA